MLNKIRMSIVNPGGLIAYRKDSLFKVFGYLLFFAFLMSAGTLITIMTYRGITQQTRSIVMEEVEAAPSNCAIVDATLQCDDALTHTLYDMESFQFMIDSSNTINTAEFETNTVYFIVHQDMLHVIVRNFFGVAEHMVRIDELHPDVHNLALDFDEQTKADFEEAVFSAVNREVLNARPIWGSLWVGVSVLSALLLFNVFVLLNTILTRARLRPVPFKQMYVMMSYAATLLYVVLIFDSIWSFNLILLLILLFVAFRQMSRLAFEIQKRLYKQ